MVIGTGRAAMKKKYVLGIERNHSNPSFYIHLNLLYP